MTARPAFPSPDASGAAAPRSPARAVRRAAFVLGAAVLGYGAFAIAFPAR
ncbi:cytochrome-c peroxidase, partial [Burkholderia diffusa]